MFAWDEAKRQANPKKHRNDFSVTHNERGDAVRGISIRKATEHEALY